METGPNSSTFSAAEYELSSDLSRIDWERVHVWWGDERWLPAGDAERNGSTLHYTAATMMAGAVRLRKAVADFD